MTTIKISHDKSRFQDGLIFLQGSKNSMLNNLCLPLYTKENCIIHNVPNIRDINDNLKFLENLGCSVKHRAKNTVEISSANFKQADYDPKLSIRTTGSKLFIPAIVNTFGSYKTGSSQGCNIGDRGFENYANSLRNFGIDYKKGQDELYEFYLTNNIQNDISLPFPSFGLTVNAILAAMATKKDFKINKICQEPEIENTIAMFNSMGANILINNGNIAVVCGGPQKLDNVLSSDSQPERSFA